MKLFVLLSLVAVAAAAVAPQVDLLEDPALQAQVAAAAPAERNQVLINILINQMIAYVRRVINNGSPLFGLPPLDPLELDQFQLSLPAGLINLEIEVTKGVATGFGGFVVNRSFFRAADLTFDLDLTVPVIDIKADRYRLEGDFFTAIPLYGDGTARFVARDFRVRALLYLRQSDDGASLIIDRVESPWFEIPVIESELTGVIGGGDVDAIVNAIVSEVIVDYVNRFNGPISVIGGVAVQAILNPILNSLDTWRYIERFV